MSIDFCFGFKDVTKFDYATIFLVLADFNGFILVL